MLWKIQVIAIVEYDRDTDANLMVDIDNVDFSLKQRFKLLNECILPFQPLHLNREMKCLQSNFLRAVNKEPLQLLQWQGTWSWFDIFSIRTSHQTY